MCAPHRCVVTGYSAAHGKISLRKISERVSAAMAADTSQTMPFTDADSTVCVFIEKNSPVSLQLRAVDIESQHHKHLTAAPRPPAFRHCHPWQRPDDGLQLLLHRLQGQELYKTITRFLQYYSAERVTRQLEEEPQSQLPLRAALT